MISDDRVEEFENARVVVGIDWGNGVEEAEITIAHFTSTMKEKYPDVERSPDDSFIYYYADTDEWNELLNSKSGELIADGVPFIRFA